MALMSPPPWVSFSPFDFVNAAGSGARLGLERAGQTIQQQDAADRLGLGYAQLGGENARAGQQAGLESQRITAANALRAAELFQANQFHTAENSTRNREIDLMNQFHTGEINNQQLRLGLAQDKFARGSEPPTPITVGGANLLKVAHPSGYYDYKPLPNTDMVPTKETHDGVDYMKIPGERGGFQWKAIPSAKPDLTPEQKRTWAFRYDKELRDLASKTKTAKGETLDISEGSQPDPGWSADTMLQWRQAKLDAAAIRAKQRALNPPQQAPAAALSAPTAEVPYDGRESTGSAADSLSAPSDFSGGSTNSFKRGNFIVTPLQ